MPLTPTQQAGLRKLGDVMIPGDEVLPSFSACGCAAHVERMLAHMNAGDRDGVTALLTVVRFLPRVVIRALLGAAVRGRRRRIRSVPPAARSISGSRASS